MCTSTVVVADAAAWPHPLIVTLLNTLVLLSGMLTSVPLVAVQPGGGGGGGVPPSPTNSSLFGEPVPGLVTLFDVALLTSVSRTCCGVKPGFAASTSAAAPATCGAAIDVPL